MDMSLLIAIVSGAGFIGLIVYYISLKNKSKGVRYVAKDNSSSVDYVQPKSAFIAKLLAPLAGLNGSIMPQGMKRKLNESLLSADVSLKSEEFFALQEIFAIVVALAAFILFSGTNFLMLSVIIGLGLGFTMPSIWLNKKVAAKKLAIVRSLPYVIDMLTLAVGAGLDFMQGIRWIVERTKIENNAMLQEMAIVLREIRLGRSKKEALKGMASRLNIPEVTSFVRTIVQSDRMGTSVEEAFRLLSEDTRRRRFQRGERLALQAPLKMLIPLILCILPTVMIVVAGPVLLQFLQGDFKF